MRDPGTEYLVHALAAMASGPMPADKTRVPKERDQRSFEESQRRLALAEERRKRKRLKRLRHHG